MADELLHITHGDSACGHLERARVPGAFLGWDDVLHEGRVPAGLSIDALADVRARFLSDRGWGDFDEIRAKLLERNERLRQAARSGRVVLWSTFELFDQLHLWQMLDWFERRRGLAPAPAIIRLAGYFGDQSKADLRGRFVNRTACSEDEISQASEIWQRFCSADPSALVTRFRQESKRLPFEKAALQRLLEEYPDARSGLTRTQKQILSLVDEQPRGPGPLFRASQALESPAFMGDWSFFVAVAELTSGARAALTVDHGRPFVYPPRVEIGDPRFSDQRLELSAFGKRVLAGQADLIKHNGVDRWIGGVHLRPDNDWRWNGETLERRP